MRMRVAEVKALYEEKVAIKMVLCIVVHVPSSSKRFDLRVTVTIKLPTNTLYVIHNHRALFIRLAAGAS